MTEKADFNAEEWSLVVKGPPMAGLRVMTAERGGTLRESVSLAQAYVEIRQDKGTSGLLDEIVSSPPAIQPAELGSSPDEVTRNSVQRLREAVDVMERRASADELEAYKGFVLELARRVAAAHKEGGFLGVGGKPVSEGEQAAIDEIAATLRA